MIPAAHHLPPILLLVVSLGLAACGSSPAPLPPKPDEKQFPKKDYSALRIGGRETLKLPGIGIIHADKRLDVEGGVLWSGRVFLEIALPVSGEKPTVLYAYAEKARSNGKGNMLCLEGRAIVEGPHFVNQSSEAGTRIFFDDSGKMTTQGGHETLFY